jgi:hypothetical protein
MHPFPPEAGLPNFVGDEIVQVWLDPWGVRLLFGSGIQLYIEEGYEQTEPGGKVWAYDCDAANGPAVLIQRHLYQKIVGMKREELRLTLSMADGATLAILSELGPHESGHIDLLNGGMVVF